MDSEKGALLSWLGEVFLRRASRDVLTPKPWLPDLPSLSQILLDSDMYILTPQCRREIRMLGVAANLSFAEYTASHHSPLVQRGGSAAYPILLDDYTDATSVSDHLPTAEEDSVSTPQSNHSALVGSASEVSPDGADESLDSALERLIIEDMLHTGPAESQANSGSSDSELSVLTSKFAETSINPSLVAKTVEGNSDSEMHMHSPPRR